MEIEQIIEAVKNEDLIVLQQIAKQHKKSEKSKNERRTKQNSDQISD